MVIVSDEAARKGPRRARARAYVRARARECRAGDRRYEIGDPGVGDGSAGKYRVVGRYGRVHGEALLIGSRRRDDLLVSSRQIGIPPELSAVAGGTALFPGNRGVARGNNGNAGSVQGPLVGL